MKSTTKRAVFGPKKYLAIAIPFLMAAQAQGFEFRMGEIEASFDSQLSVGSSWRVEAQDPNLIADVNGGSGNSDDGNKNYKKGDAFSQIFKGSHDLQFSYQNFGGFVRGKYWYDSALANNRVRYGHLPTANRGASPATLTDLDYSNAATKLDDSEFNDLSKASGATVLDAFVYGEFEVMDMPVDVRLGKQVVSWGEGTFIRGGVNAINPIDVNAFVRPGAEIKEGLLPVNMLYTNVGLSDSLSFEAFYQLGFQETVIPGCGTYFATNDYAPEGCNAVSALNGSFSVARDVDGNREASDDGQFGVAFRYLSEALGDTEFGFYAMNIHSRAPLAMGIKNTVDEAQIGIDYVTAQVTPVVIAGQTAIGTALATGVYTENSAEHGAALLALQASIAQAQVAATPGARLTAVAQIVDSTRYFLAYPEDIQIAGLSFATNAGEIALSGEISHKLGLPIQINGPMVIGTLVTGSSTATELNEDYNNTADGEISQGFRLFDVSQVQVTAIKFIDQVAGANRMTLIGEVGYTHIHDFYEGADAIKFGRSDTFGKFGPNADGTINPGNVDDGFVTSSSWGYRGRLVAEYSDAFLGVNLKPTLAWSHDVKGYAPQPGGNFSEGQKSLGLSIEASYLETYSANLSYTQYMGGDYSVISDHDFASINVGMQF
jgi:hypothetical protein